MRCEKEYPRSETDPLGADHGLWTTLSRKDTRRKNLTSNLLNLNWRTRKQMAVFEVFCTLYEYGLSSVDALAPLIEYRRTPANVLEVEKMLCCFTKISDFDELPLIHGKPVLNSFD